MQDSRQLVDEEMKKGYVSIQAGPRPRGRALRLENRFTKQMTQLRATHSNSRWSLGFLFNVAACPSPRLRHFNDPPGTQTRGRERSRANSRRRENKGSRRRRKETVNVAKERSVIIPAWTQKIAGRSKGKKEWKRETGKERAADGAKTTTWKGVVGCG